MNVKKEDYRGRMQVLSVEWAVRSIVDSAPDYHDGEIESLKAKIDKLTEIVGVLVRATRQTEDGIVDLLNTFDHGWESAE